MPSESFTLNGPTSVQIDQAIRELFGFPVLAKDDVRCIRDTMSVIDHGKLSTSGNHALVIQWDWKASNLTVLVYKDTNTNG